MSQKKIFRFNFILAFAVVVSAATSHASLCSQWTPYLAGEFDNKDLDEQSGMAASSQYIDRLYHINDSGDVPKLFVTDTSGKFLASTLYFDKFTLDTEDMDYGKCDAGGSKKCLYIGDIGDNLGIRPVLVVHVIEEQKDWPAKVSALRTLTLTFPDGRHDTEAFAIHPNGDLILITKAYTAGKKQSLKAGIYKLDAAQVFAGGIHILKKIGELDIPKISGSDDYHNVVTSMSIAPDGKTALLLTYNGAVEIDFDFSKSAFPQSLRENIDYRSIKIAKLKQQEALTYSADGKSFFYSTEGKKSPLYKVTCTAR